MNALNTLQPIGWFIQIGGVLLIVCAHIAAHGQAGNLTGTWINDRMQAAVIGDMTGERNANYLSAGDFSRSFNLVKRGDTLDFTNSYTSSADKFKQVHTDHLMFTATQPDRRTLVLIPVSKLAEKFFGNRRPIVVNRQELTIDSTIHFEKLAFASGPCYGTCPVYEFAVDSSGRVRLHVLKAHYRHQEDSIDVAAQGYFVGQLSDSLRYRLINALQTCYLRQWGAIESKLCCDAPQQSLSVYFNGQQQTFNTQFPPIVVEKLIDVLRTIYATCPRQRVKTPFVIENPAKRIR